MSGQKRYTLRDAVTFLTRNFKMFVIEVKDQTVGFNDY